MAIKQIYDLTKTDKVYRILLIGDHIIIYNKSNLTKLSN